MKTILILLLLSSSAVVAQQKEIDTLHFTISGEPTDQSTLLGYYKVVEKKDSLYVVSKYETSDNRLVYFGTYSDPQLTIREGHFVYFDNEGNPSSECDYKNDLEDGVYHKYYSSGNVYYSETYTAGKLNGPVLAYYENEKLKRNDIYKDGVFVSGKCFNEDSVEITHFDWIETASYVGGTVAMRKFLIKNIKYPRKAMREGRTGKVLLKFVVTKEGDIGSVVVIQSAGEEFDKEALRVVKKMPKWNPGTIDGQSVNSYFILPVTFKL